MYVCMYMPQCQTFVLRPAASVRRMCQCTTEPSHSSSTSALAVFKSLRGMGSMRTGTSTQDMTRMGWCGALTHCTFSLHEKHLLRLPLSVVFPFTFINIKLWHHKNLMNINDGNCKKYFGWYVYFKFKFFYPQSIPDQPGICTNPTAKVRLFMRFMLNTPHKSSKKIRWRVRLPV